MLKKYKKIQPPDNIIKDGTNDFLDGLRQSATTYNVPDDSLRQLLSLLKTILVHENLRNDPRILLKTSRKIDFKNIEPDVYAHSGLKVTIEKLINKVNNNTLLSIELLINIDGLLLSKSSSSQLYPILCSLFQYPHNIDVIGVYHDYDKPTSANKLLADFVEAIDLVNNGFMYQGKVVPFEGFYFCRPCSLI